MSNRPHFWRIRSREPNSVDLPFPERVSRISVHPSRRQMLQLQCAVVVVAGRLSVLGQ
jgi:hypothetical protein